MKHQTSKLRAVSIISLLKHAFQYLLPPAYVVRREGNSFTLFVCPHGGGGGVRVPPWGGPGQVPPPGGSRYPPGGGTRVRYPPGVLGPPSPPGGYLTLVPPRGVPGPPGGVPDPGTPPGGYLTRVPPRGGTRTPLGRYPGPGTPPGGGTWVGQQKEYSLHGGRYASYVHAGGLSCSNNICNYLFHIFMYSCINFTLFAIVLLLLTQILM